MRESSRRNTFFKDAVLKALEIVTRNRDIMRLYEKAAASYGKGELFNIIMEQAIETMNQKESIEVFFSNEENLVSFLCAIWLQFLMVEVGGIEHKKLQKVARTFFEEQKKSITIH